MSQSVLAVRPHGTAVRWNQLEPQPPNPVECIHTSTRPFLHMSGLQRTVSVQVGKRPNPDEKERDWRWRHLLLIQILQGVGRVPLREHVDGPLACCWAPGSRGNLGGSSSGLGREVCVGSQTSSEMRESDHEHLWHFICIFHCCLNPRSHNWWPLCMWCWCVSECVRECERGKEAEWEKLLSGEISRHVCAENQIQSQEPFVGYLLCPQGLCGTCPSILPFGSLCNSFKWKNYVAHFTDEETEAHWIEWAAFFFFFFFNGLHSMLTSIITPLLCWKSCHASSPASALSFQSLRDGLCSECL